MSDLINRADALSCFHDWVDSKGDVHSADEMPEYRRIEKLPSADLKLIAERCIPEECKDDLVNRREVYRLKLMSVTDWDFGQALINLPSAEPEPKCNSCRYRNLEWYEEPCDSCTVGGKNCHYKPEPERLTDDDFETIRIHLSAYKERLGNQHRWKEAEEYQRIIDRFVSFASAESEIIRCKDCKYWTHIKRTNRYWCKTDDGLFDLSPSPDDFCSRAERRTE